MEIPFGRHLAQMAPLWSISVTFASMCILVPMPELLTTDEAADYLRLSERKLYELVAERAVPCSKVTGGWLFTRTTLDSWVAASLIAPDALATMTAPPIVRRRHGPLMEWALRDGASVLVSITDRSE